jgi:hypothetical protein
MIDINTSVCFSCLSLIFIPGTVGFLVDYFPETQVYVVAWRQMLSPAVMCLFDWPTTAGVNTQIQSLRATSV